MIESTMDANDTNEKQWIERETDPNQSVSDTAYQIRAVGCIRLVRDWRKQQASDKGHSRGASPELAGVGGGLCLTNKTQSQLRPATATGENDDEHNTRMGIWSRSKMGERMMMLATRNIVLYCDSFLPCA